MSIVIQREDPRSLFHAIAPLLQKHWDEIALDKDAIKLDPDWARYADMAAKGSLVTITVRDEGELVGYAAFFLAPHLHYRTSLTAVSDIFFLRKDYRVGRTGIKLFQVAERELKALGVQKLCIMHKLHLDVGAIFERLGFRAIERTYSKLIG